MADEFVNISEQGALPTYRILVVGLTCIDVINFCKHYPKEDEDMSVLSQRWAVGGNAANTARVLAQHKNTKVSLFSGLSLKSENQFVIKELQECGIDLKYCSYNDKFNFPNSTCIINSQNGSRTILSRNNFPLLDFNAFKNKIDIDNFDLIHFEGRDLPEVKQMVDYVLQNRNLNSPLVSGEMEKPKRLEELELYIQPKVDILFLSKDIAKAKGFSDSNNAVNQMLTKSLNARLIICAWGEKGASYARKADDDWEIGHVQAFPVPIPKDTLGAGDTFIAGVLYGVLKKWDSKKATKYGCWLAKKKIEIIGFQNLV